VDELVWYLWILGGLFLTGMGIIPFIPEEAAVLGVASIVTANHLNLWIGWLCCIIGIIGTDVVLYSLGRFGGPKLFASRMGRYFLSPERQGKITNGFSKHGIKFLLSGRLLPGVRTGIFITAGAIHYPIWRFILADAISIPVISFFYFGGYFAADRIKMIIANVDHAKNWLLLLAILAVGSYLAYRYVKYLKLKSADESKELAVLPPEIVAQIEGEPEQAAAPEPPVTSKP
jgi:membrane-associated protein